MQSKVVTEKYISTNLQICIHYVYATHKGVLLTLFRRKQSRFDTINVLIHHNPKVFCEFLRNTMILFMEVFFQLNSLSMIGNFGLFGEL